MYTTVYYNILQEATLAATNPLQCQGQPSFPEGTSTKESARRMNSAFAFRSSGVAMATKVISCSEPNSVKVHLIGARDV